MTHTATTMKKSVTQIRDSTFPRQTATFVIIAVTVATATMIAANAPAIAAAESDIATS